MTRGLAVASPFIAQASSSKNSAVQCAFSGLCEIDEEVAEVREKHLGAQDNLESLYGKCSHDCAVQKDFDALVETIRCAVERVKNALEDAKNTQGRADLLDEDEAKTIIDFFNDVRQVTEGLYVADRQSALMQFVSSCEKTGLCAMAKLVKSGDCSRVAHYLSTEIENPYWSRGFRAEVVDVLFERHDEPDVFSAYVEPAA